MDDLAKEVVDEELVKKVNRYMQHLETARKSARKYYERNREVVQERTKQRYRENAENYRERYINDPEVRKKAYDYAKRRKQRMKEQKMQDLNSDVEISE
jgi:hypothetical protein